MLSAKLLTAWFSGDAVVGELADGGGFYFKDELVGDLFGLNSSA